MAIALILDTSREPAFIALIKGEEILSFQLIEEPKKLSTLLFLSIQTLLQETGVKIQDLAYVGVGVGPGAYMGIRTSAILAKTFSFTHSLPLLSFLSPYAFLPKEKQGSFAYVGDAKMGEFFVLTGRVEKKLTDLSPPVLLSPEKLEPYIRNKDFIVQAKEARPNLELLAHYMYTKFLERDFSTTFELPLTYLRF